MPRILLAIWHKVPCNVFYLFLNWSDAREARRGCRDGVYMPDVDDDASLLPAMKKARDNEEQREEKIDVLCT